MCTFDKSPTQQIRQYTRFAEWQLDTYSTLNRSKAENVYNVLFPQNKRVELTQHGKGLCEPLREMAFDIWELHRQPDDDTI